MRKPRRARARWGSNRTPVILAMLGALLYAVTFVMKVLPNIHLLAMLIIVLTRVYRVRALIPIYIYVLLEGVLQGFSPWWVPYLYVWTVLWAAVMLLPRQISTPAAAVLYCGLGFAHGALFGVLWAPYHALIYGLDFSGALAWVAAGLPFDAIHAVSNGICCTLATPLISLFTKLEKKNSFD